MGQIIRNGVVYSASASEASQVTYDNTVSQLLSDSVQSAIDELADKSATSGEAISAIETSLANIARSIAKNDLTLLGGSSNWQTNTTYGDTTAYTKMQHIASSEYTDTSKVSCEILAGNPNNIPTTSELSDMSKLCRFMVVDSTGIIVIATEATTNNLTLRITGK